MRNLSLFEDQRLTSDDALDLIPQIFSDGIEQSLLGLALEER
jgi:hypothetical protein